MSGRWRDATFTVVTTSALVVLAGGFACLLATLVVAGAPALAGLSNDPDLPRSVYGTVLCTLLMTIAVVPFGVATAVHLSEYARPDGRLLAAVRRAIRTLASVPSIVFGLFGLGFFVLFVGRGLDRVSGAEGELGRPGVLWASLTLAVLTLPVVVVTAEGALRAVPRELREASQALGASKLQTVLHVVLPSARSGVLTGAILAVSRGAGEVAAILFTGVASYVPGYPVDVRAGFQHLGFHVYVLATQAPPTSGSEATMFAFALVFVAATIGLNALAFLVRDRARRTT